MGRHGGRPSHEKWCRSGLCPKGTTSLSPGVFQKKIGFKRAERACRAASHVFDRYGLPVRARASVYYLCVPITEEFE
jgi:hypothetical protein